jgi:ribosomal protein S20
MNKKQRNRKNVTQNKRNRMINRRYSSTIKTFFKLFLIQIQETKQIFERELKTEKIVELKNLQNKLFSLIDKGVKKRVFHKNTANRKKSKIGILLKPSI